MFMVNQGKEKNCFWARNNNTFRSVFKAVGFVIALKTVKAIADKY